MRQAVLAAVALVAGALVAVVALQPAPQAASKFDAEAAALEPMSLREVVAAGEAPPAWELGDAWRVQFDDNDAICWLAVVDVTDDGYQQGVWCPTDEAAGIAMQIAGFDVRYAGLLTKDLGGVGVGAAEDTRWFDWPLEDGKSWSTSWYGQEAVVEVELDEEDHRYELSLCVVDGDCAASYDYDPRLAWWSEVDFNDGFRFRVHERDEGWSREATYATATDRFHEWRSSVNALVTSPQSFQVPEEDDALLLIVERLGSHTGRFELRDGAATVAYQDTFVSDSEPIYSFVSGAPGIWTIVDATLGIADSETWVRGISVETVELD